MIGIIGKKGSGKSTVAQFLQTHHNAKIYSLSSPIKQIAQIFGFSHQSLFGHQSDKEAPTKMGISAREFLQKFGTEFGREIFPQLFPGFKLDYQNIWIQLFHNEYKNQTQNKNPNKSYQKNASKPPLFVIDDIRFPDEAAYIKQQNGILVKVVRNANLTKDLHKSEMEQDAIIPDVILENFGTLDALIARLISFGDLLEVSRQSQSKS